MLFVSHDPAAVKTLCDRALLLDQGLLIREGPSEAVLDYYNAMIARREKEASIHQAESEGDRASTRSGDGKVAIAGVRMSDTDGAEASSFTTGERAAIEIDLEFREAMPEYTVGLLIRDRLGNEVFGANTTYLDVPTPAASAGERLTARFGLGLELGHGHYALTVAVHAPTGHVSENHDWIDNVLSFQVIPGDTYRFAGVAHLPVEAEIRSAS